jgi:galactoside 2-L-fucosyltransferase 1/2
MKLIDEKLWLSGKEFNQLMNIEKRESVCTFLPELLQLNAFKNIELGGYWQSYLYFDAYREDIRKIFTARNDALVRLAKYFTQIRKRICPSCSSLPDATHQQLREAIQTRYNIIWISIHIRRRDFIDVHYSSDDDYIHRAINFFRERYYQYRVRFLVASDDRNYCRRLFASEVKSGNVIILPDNFSPSDDLMALSLCHHSIVTGGTFGFWSGYLAGGQVIHDNKYKVECSRSDYYPPWFILAGVVEQRTG